MQNKKPQIISRVGEEVSYRGISGTLRLEKRELSHLSKIEKELYGNLFVADREGKKYPVHQVGYGRSPSRFHEYCAINDLGEIEDK